jgi:hypothetical protein
MITIKVVSYSEKHDKIAHVENEKDCKQWLKLMHGSFNMVEIKNAKTRAVHRFHSKYELNNWLEKK